MTLMSKIGLYQPKLCIHIHKIKNKQSIFNNNIILFIIYILNYYISPIYSIIHDFAFPFGVEIVKLP